MFKEFRLLTLLIVSFSTMAHADEVYYCGTKKITLRYGMIAGRGKVKIEQATFTGVPLIEKGKFITTRSEHKPVKVQLIGFEKELHLYDNRYVLVDTKNQKNIIQCTFVDEI